MAFKQAWAYSILYLMVAQPCFAGFLQYASGIDTAGTGTIASDLLDQPQTYNQGLPSVTKSQAGFDAFIAGAFSDLGANAVFGIERFEHFTDNVAQPPTGKPATNQIMLNLQFNQYLPNVPGVSSDALPITAVLDGKTGQIARIDGTDINPLDPTNPIETSAGRFPVRLPLRGINGDQYYDTNFADMAFMIDFGETPVDAFGFFGTDLGDFNGQVQLGITDVLGVESTVLVRHERAPASSPTDPLNASLVFFGITSDTSIRTITFQNTVTDQGDRFGFDNFVVALQETSAVPEPKAFVLFFVGAILLGFAHRRRQLAI